MSAIAEGPLDLDSLRPSSLSDREYGRSIKEIPKCMWNLISNPVYIVTCLGSCMELLIVSGFLVFLPKYLETQFTISKSQANLFAGGIAVPGACFGIFLGGFLLKKFQLGIKGETVARCSLHKRSRILRRRSGQRVRCARRRLS